MLSVRLACVCGLLAILVPGVRAQEDPTVAGKKVSEWFKFLRDEPDARRRQAALMLIDTQAGPKVGVVFPGLLKELREHPDPAVREKIVQILPKYKDKGDDVVNAIKGALATDKEGKVREAAVVAIGKLDRGMSFMAVKELGDTLKDKYAPARAAAAETIGNFSAIDHEIAKDSIPALAEALKDAERPVRLQAAFALGRMEAAAAPAVPALAAALGNEKELAVRKEIIKSLATIGRAAKEAAPALVKELQNQNADIRKATVIALGKIAPDPAVALAALLKAAMDREPAVRVHAIHAVGSLGKGALSAIPELIEILRKDEVADVRVAAIEELAGFGPDAKAAIDALSVAAKDGRPAIREAAQEALKKVQQSP